MRLIRRLAPAMWLTLAACGLSTPTASPYLFKDDFSHDLSLWDIFEEPGAASAIVEGRMMLTVTSQSSVAFTLAALNVSDFDLTVRTLHVAGGSANTYGLIFRYVDNNNFYRFDISEDGLWGVSRRQGDQWISILEFTASPNIRTGPAAENTLRIWARADEFMFYANGLELGRVRDNTLPAGRIGLFASTFEEANIQASFDDVTVVDP